MADLFIPSEHPALTDLGARLRELAGDASYVAGRDYLKKGLVKQGAVAGTTAFASVSGSTDYRVSIAFGGEDHKVTCTCPAHRRNKYCKHVVAVCEALLNQPNAFVPTDPVPEAPAAAPKEKKSRAPKSKSADEEKTEKQSAGLETVDRLLEELAAGGLVTLGADKAGLIAGTGELVRALKLRRLGNLIMLLQRAAVAGIEPGEFARLLADIYLTRTAVGAHLEGRLALDPSLAEELLGKTWRDGDLEPVSGLSLMELAFHRLNDGEFRIETSYLIDIASGQLFAEKLITPVALGSGGKLSYRQRIVVEEAGLYPGDAPRRIKLLKARRAPLSAADVRGAVVSAVTTVAELRLKLSERLVSPFGVAEVPVLFRPGALVTQGSLAGAIDATGQFLRLIWPPEWSKELPGLLPEPGEYALFGLLTLDSHGLELRCLSVVSPALRWSHGPVYQEQGGDGHARRN